MVKPAIERSGEYEDNLEFCTKLIIRKHIELDYEVYFYNII